MNKKRIICFGDSNTWGYNAITGGRFDDDQRWTGVLSKELGDDYVVVEEGLPGRTTVFEDPLNEGMCGFKYIYTCLMTHSPLDMLIIMLGTNDTKERFSASSRNIADGVDRLIKKARMLPVWRDENQRILILAPIKIDKKYYNSPVGGEMGAKCAEKSWELCELIKDCAKMNKCEFLDVNDFSGVNQIDFMHIDLEGHQAAGKAIADKVKTMV